jgi:hypothetical protein
MKTESEIRRILTEDLGFKDLAAYQKWVSEQRPRVSLTPEVLERLSPDAIDCPAFWRVCEEIFGNDPVCNVAVPPSVGSLPHEAESRMDANRLNLQLAKSMGVTAFLDEFAHERVKTLEVGPGFGSLKHYIETHTKHVYAAVDVFPRLPGVIAATAQGFIPDSFVAEQKGQYAYVVSSNVFQHLSARQRSRYFKDAHALLHKGGLFIFNLYVDAGGSYLRDPSGVAWCDHYGQYTLVPKPAAVQAELSSAFGILYATQRYDGLVNFVCQKRE